MWTNLMAQIATETNLYEAWRKVRSNKGAAGVDAVSIQAFEARLDDHLPDLHNRLHEDTYYPLPLRRTTIPKRDGGERGLAIPTIADRVVQRAFVNVLEPLFEEVFLDGNYGYRPGRNVEQAVQAILRHRQAGYDWILDADIVRFFDSVNHALLMERLRDYIADRAVLRTIQMWLDMGVLTDGRSPRVNLLQTTANYVREVAQETVNHLLGCDFYAPVGPSAALVASTELETVDPQRPEEAAEEGRRQALTRFGRDAVLLALTFRRVLTPLLTGRALLVGGGIGAAVVGMTALGKYLLNTRTWRSTRVGTPQGSPLSPLLANVYLHPFDVAMTQGGLRLVRYADDFVVCCASQLRARQALQTARRELGRLRLSVNEMKTRIVGCEDEFAFLGHIFDGEGAFALHDGRHLDMVHEVLDTLGHSARQSSHVVAETGKRMGNTGMKMMRRFGDTFVHDLKERWNEIRRES